ncbi:MAG: ABC transporter substrate-binding protein [Bacteroidales bacterium]|nr:ABC transporter substrate-binding protein [Bacteroidales bacterium]
MKKILPVLFLWLITACSQQAVRPETAMEYARWFTLTDSSVVVMQPGGGADTLKGQYGRLICMSSSYVGFLDAIGADSTVAGVSGLKFLGHTPSQAVEVGYDAALDYEAIVQAQPDLFLTYAVGAVEPLYLNKLRELGIKTVILSEHLESHPLARAEYVKLFGALTGRRAQADSVFTLVRDHYLELVQPSTTKKVLINIPYADQWYIPGGDNFMTRLIEDAGGQLLGTVPGHQESSVIDMETALRYAQEADVWLHPGWCRNKDQLLSVHPLFTEFHIDSIWNNTLQTTPGGGNMFWETGPVRPDLILQDLTSILSGTATSPLNYYLPVE